LKLDLQVKHYIAVFPLFSVNFPGFYIQRNISGICNFILVYLVVLYVIICLRFFISIFLSVLFKVFVSLPSVSPLWRSKNQSSGNACSRTPTAGWPTFCTPYTPISSNPSSLPMRHIIGYFL